MKKRMIVFLILVLLLPIVYSQQFNLGSPEVPNSHQISQLAAVGYGTLGFGFLVVVILLFAKSMGPITKKIVFMLIVVVVLATTLYIIITTIQLNVKSQTKGPVHWHADFEIWACDKQIKLAEPKGLSNKQGVSLLHSHNDNRIHVEGVLMDKNDASLGAFFSAVGGYLKDDSIEVKTDDGLVSLGNGDKCNGLSASLYVFVNEKLIAHPSAYVISPYEKVPPGDRIKLIFTEKPVEEINPRINQNGS